VRFQKICVLGLGYIGLPTASTFATHGLEVVGVDVNRSVVETLQNGGVHIHEPGLRTLVQAATRSGNLRITGEPESADAFIIAVPTPFLGDKRADLSYVETAAEAIVPHLAPGNLVVLESTSPPRTTSDVVAPILDRSGLKAGIDYHLAYTPERVLPGQILREMIENARVIGGVNQASATAGQDLYRVFVRGEIILTDSTTAEMVKLMENTYRDVNIAIANEFSRLAERQGINIWEAIELANRHPRVNILNPGPGVGGHCISVDPWFLVESAPDLTKLILSARQVNEMQPQYVLDLIQRSIPNERAELQGRRIAALGLAYKADIDDLRESPAIEVIRLLDKAGALVKAYDPYQSAHQNHGVGIVSTLDEAVQDAEMLVLLVAHKPLIQLEPDQLAGMTPARILVDTVNGWSKQPWQQAGFKLSRLGVD
jgi:UDP-N-acetyl-D-mannosaminuronic acid dehydrogenase